MGIGHLPQNPLAKLTALPDPIDGLTKKGNKGREGKRKEKLGGEGEREEAGWRWREGEGVGHTEHLKLS